MLLSCGGSSPLVVDKLCDQNRGKDIAVMCFTFDIALRKEQCTACMLGSLLKRVVGGMEGIQEESSPAFKERKKAIGEREAHLADIVKMLLAITS